MPTIFGFIQTAIEQSIAIFTLKKMSSNDIMASSQAAYRHTLHHTWSRVLYNSWQIPHGENCAMQNLQLNQHLHDDPTGHSSSLIQPVGAAASRNETGSSASRLGSYVASGANTGTSTPSRGNDIDMENWRFLLIMLPPLLKFVFVRRPNALLRIDVDCTPIFSSGTRSVTPSSCADDMAKTERTQRDLSILLR